MFELYWYAKLFEMHIFKSSFIVVNNQNSCYSFDLVETEKSTNISYFNIYHISKAANSEWFCILIKLLCRFDDFRFAINSWFIFDMIGHIICYLLFFLYLRNAGKCFLYSIFYLVIYLKIFLVLVIFIHDSFSFIKLPSTMWR